MWTPAAAQVGFLDESWDTLKCVLPAKLRAAVLDSTTGVGATASEDKGGEPEAADSVPQHVTLEVEAQLGAMDKTVASLKLGLGDTHMHEAWELYRKLLTRTQLPALRETVRRLLELGRAEGGDDAERRRDVDSAGNENDH
eukprot:4367589-Pyramimonas_sp.AAC.1